MNKTLSLLQQINLQQIKPLFKKVLVFLALSWFLLIPGQVFSQDNIDENWCEGEFSEVCFDNPFGSNEPQSLKELILMILQIIIYVAIPLIVLGFVYAGFLFLSGQGKDEDLGKAKRVLIYSIVGAVIILSAQGIYNLIDATGRAILDVS